MAETLTPLPDPPLNDAPSEPAEVVVDNNQVGGVSAPVDTTSTDNTSTEQDNPTSDTTTTSTTQDTTDDTSAPFPTDEQIVDSMRVIMKEQEINSITLRILVSKLEEEFGQNLAIKKAFIKEKIPVLLQEQEENGEAEAEAEEEVDEEKEDNEEEAENPTDAKEAQEALNLSGEDVAVQKLLLEQIKYGGGRVTRGRASGKAPPKPLKQKKRKSTDDNEEDTEPKKKRKGTSRANRPKNLSPALAEFIGESAMPRPDVVKRLHEYIKANDLQDPKNKRNIVFDEKLQQVFKRKTTDFFKLNALLSKHLTDPGELV